MSDPPNGCTDYHSYSDSTPLVPDTPPVSVDKNENKDHPPLPQPGHPTQQAYPPQYLGYPPQYLGYPPQYLGYAPHQAFYPTQGYVPPQPLSKVEGGPPAYNQANPPAATPVVQQQASTNVVVVKEQPTPTVHTKKARPVSDGFLILSIVLTICCFICCSYYSLVCTIPALIFAIKAQDARQCGDDAKAKTHSIISLALNIAAIVCWIVTAVVIVVSISTTSTGVSGGSDGSSSDSSDSYSYRYSYTDVDCDYYYYDCYYYTRYRTGYYK